MKVLALELSTARGSLAWGDREVEEKDWPNDRQNSGLFFTHLQEAIATRGLPDLIVVGLGPGSFAGVRIAISAGLGLEAAGSSRLAGLPSICAMSSEPADYYAVGDARRQAFFLARIENHALRGEPELLNEAGLRARLDDLASRPVLSSDRLPQFPQIQSAFPSAARLARLVLDGNHHLAEPPLEPMYLREPHITMPRKIIYPVSPK